MPIFGGRSIANLKTAHPDIQRVMRAAIADYDFMVLQSSRTKDEQEADFAKGVSKAHWLQSPHDFTPSLAVDCCPYPLDWKDITAFTQMASIILSHAIVLKVDMTWGGSWKPPIQKDYPHFQLTNWKALSKQKAPAVNQGLVA